MAKPEQCGHCKKEATIHLTQIINNKINKVDLCEDCPFKQGVTNAEGFSLADFLLKPPSGAQMADSELVCDACGFTPVDFKKTGRFGCPSCYSSFGDMLKPMLSNMHKDVVHRGKIPEKSIARVDRQRRIHDLEIALKDAVSDERFEEAARLRDDLLSLKKSATSRSSETPSIG